MQLSARINVMEISRQIILEPRDLWWERNGVFNPASCLLGNKTYLVYRAVGSDHISRFGLAVSHDGVKFERFNAPWMEGDEDNRYERLGIEDPRITQIGRDYYLSYTATSVYPSDHSGPLAPSLNTPGTPWRNRTTIARTRDFSQVTKLGVALPDLDSKDSALFPRQIGGQYWLLHRIVPHVFISSSKNLNRFDGGMRLFGPKEGWESLKVGAACPPIEVEDGWLLIYHGVSEGHVYSIGAVLLEKNNPTLILKRTPTPFLKPVESWEKKGAVNHVVFVSGSVLLGDQLNLYYGGGDSVVGLARVSLSELRAHLQ